VGAAPGRHMPFLARRFPCCRFELYDPAEFDARLVDYAASEESGGRVCLKRGFFDEAAAEALVVRLRDGGCRPLVFFSDIRTADEQLMEEKDVELSIRRDMERQRSWVEALQPDLSVLKFRLPWGPGKTPYLQGRLLVQAFPPCTSTETRLVVTRQELAAGETVYDHEEYEERLMHHNTVGRARLHDLDVPLEGVPGLDRCYDCAAVADTARRFVAARNGVELAAANAQEVNAELALLLAEVGEHGGRTLAMAYHVSSSRHSGRHFARRKYRDEAGQDCFIVENSRQAKAKKRRKKQNQAPAETPAADADTDAVPTSSGDAAAAAPAK